MELKILLRFDFLADKRGHAALLRALRFLSKQNRTRQKRREASIEAIFALIQKSWANIPKIKQTDWK